MTCKYNLIKSYLKKDNQWQRCAKAIVDVRKLNKAINLAWEGFREAVDDVRYATLLQSLARPLASSTNQAARTAARHAMRLIAEADGDNFDLDDFRLSMVDAILKMLPYSEGK